MLIYLHGGGGVGDDVRRLQGQAQALLAGIAKFKKGPCYIVVPQCLRKTERWRSWDLGSKKI